MSLPQPGEHITAIDGEVFQAVVIEPSRGLATGYFRWVPSDNHRSVRAYREETEGLCWIRGWHDKDSDDVCALLAADKLWASSFIGGSRMVFGKDTATYALRGISVPILEDGTVDFSKAPAHATSEDVYYTIF